MPELIKRRLCADKRRQQPSSRNGGVNVRWWRFRVGEGTLAYHVRAWGRVAGWRGLLSSEAHRASPLGSQQQPRAHHHHHPPPPPPHHLPHHSRGWRGEISQGGKAEPEHTTERVVSRNIGVFFFALRHHVEEDDGRVLRPFASPEIKIDFVSLAWNQRPSRDKRRVVCFIFQDEPNGLLCAAECKSKPRVLVSCVNWPVRRRGPFFSQHEWSEMAERKKKKRQAYISSIQIRELHWILLVSGSHSSTKQSCGKDNQSSFPVHGVSRCLTLFIGAFDTWSKPHRCKRHLRVRCGVGLSCLGFSQVVKVYLWLEKNKWQRKGRFFQGPMILTPISSGMPAPLQHRALQGCSVYKRSIYIYLKSQHALAQIILAFPTLFCRFANVFPNYNTANHQAIAKTPMTQ